MREGDRVRKSLKTSHHSFLTLHKNKRKGGSVKLEKLSESSFLLKVQENEFHIKM